MCNGMKNVSIFVNHNVSQNNIQSLVASYKRTRRIMNIQMNIKMVMVKCSYMHMTEMFSSLLCFKIINWQSKSKTTKFSVFVMIYLVLYSVLT